VAPGGAELSGKYVERRSTERLQESRNSIVPGRDASRQKSIRYSIRLQFQGEMFFWED